MGDSEHEILEKIGKVSAKSSHITSEVKDNFAKMQKLNAESLKKLEEMMQFSEKDLEKLEQKIAKSKDLVSESKARLNAEIKTTRTQIHAKYTELKNRVASIVGLTTPTT
jgi:hypothetical protein